MNSFTISFKQSPSKLYDEVLSFATTFDTYEQIGIWEDVQHRVEFSDAQVNSFFTLYDMVRKWKGTEVLINGQLMTVKGSLFLHCYRRRCAAISGENHCFGKDGLNQYTENYFGCQYVDILNGPYANLSGYGEMDGNNVFHVNKEKIIHDLVSNECYSLCPAYNVNKMIEWVHILPNAINPTTDSHWKYYTDFDSNGEKFISVCVK